MTHCHSRSYIADFRSSHFLSFLFHKLRRTCPNEMSLLVPSLFVHKGKLLKELLLVAHEIMSHLCRRVNWPLLFVQSWKKDEPGHKSIPVQKQDRGRYAPQNTRAVCWDAEMWVPILTILSSNKSWSRLCALSHTAYDTFGSQNTLSLFNFLLFLLAFFVSFSKFFISISMRSFWRRHRSVIVSLEIQVVWQIHIVVPSLARIRKSEAGNGQ